MYLDLAARTRSFLPGIFQHSGKLPGRYCIREINVAINSGFVGLLYRLCYYVFLFLVNFIHTYILLSFCFFIILFVVIGVSLPWRHPPPILDTHPAL